MRELLFNGSISYRPPASSIHTSTTWGSELELGAGLGSRTANMGVRSLRSIFCSVVALTAGAHAAPYLKSSRASSDSVTLEAEDAVLSGTHVETEHPGFTGTAILHPRLGGTQDSALTAVAGTGYVTGFDEATDKVTFHVDSDATKLYDLSIRVAAIYGEKRTTVVLNGGANSEVYFPASDTFDDIAAGQVLLEEGANTIDIVSNWGWCVDDGCVTFPLLRKPGC